MTEGERLGIDYVHLRAAAAKMALAQTTQALAIAQAAAPENINCTRLAELLANADTYEYNGEVVMDGLIKAAKRKLQLAAAIQVRTRRVLLCDA